MKLTKHEIIRMKISTLIDTNMSLRDIASTLDVSYSTVKKIAARYRETGTVNRKKGSGRLKLLETEHKKLILGKVEENPKMSSQKLSSVLLKDTGKGVSKDTIRRTLISNNLKSCAAAVKPLLSKVHLDRRFNVAKGWIMRPFEYFKRVIFSDESRFNLFQSDGRVKVWRTPGTRYDMINCSPSVKFGGDQ